MSIMQRGNYRVNCRGSKGLMLPTPCNLGFLSCTLFPSVTPPPQSDIWKGEGVKVYEGQGRGKCLWGLGKGLRYGGVERVNEWGWARKRLIFGEGLERVKVKGVHSYFLS